MNQCKSKNPAQCKYHGLSPKKRHSNTLAKLTKSNAALDFPNLVQEYSSENSFPLSYYLPGSGVKVFWQCPVSSDHKWQAEIRKRTFRGDGCPFCSGHRASSTNNLELCNPKLASELDVDKTGFSAADITEKSNKKVYWLCEKKHSWEASPNTRSKNGCSLCSNKGVSDGDILLERSLLEKNPLIASYFNSDVNNTTPDKVSAYSNNKYKWKCIINSGHAWISSPNAMMQRKNLCLYCNDKIVTSNNNLEYLFPFLAAEFDPANNNFKPSEALPGSGKVVAWVCSQDKSHKWEAAIRSRTGRNNKSTAFGCPYCTGAHTSAIEISLRKEISFFFSVLPAEEKINLSWRKNKRMSVDIIGTYKGKKLAIEYDGYFYHKSNSEIERDLDKSKALLAAGYTVVRVREGNLPFLPIENDNMLQINYKYSMKKDSISNLIKQILEGIESFR